MLAKFSQLPVSWLVDGDTLSKCVARRSKDWLLVILLAHSARLVATLSLSYRSMLDLITSQFFGDNDFSVFAEAIAIGINMFVVILSPLLLLNLTTCSAAVVCSVEEVACIPEPACLRHDRLAW